MLAGYASAVVATADEACLDGAVDVILSNCVINLSPEKLAVFREAFRVLRTGGRLAISDVVAIAPIPSELQTQAAAIAGCIGGAAPLDDVKRMLVEAGLHAVTASASRRSTGFVMPRPWT